jgi:hypothetical protein
LRLNITGKSELQLFEPPEGERCLEMGQAAVLYGQSLTIFEVMDKGFIVLGL